MIICMEAPHVVFEFAFRGSFFAALVNEFNEKGIPFIEVLLLDDARSERLYQLDEHNLRFLRPEVEEVHQIKVELCWFENVDDILQCLRNLPESQAYSSRTPLDPHCVRRLSTLVQRQYNVDDRRPEFFSFAREELSMTDREQAVTLATHIDNNFGRWERLRNPEYVRAAFNEEGVRQSSQYELDLKRLDEVGMSHRVLLEGYYEESLHLGIGLK